ncbi:mannuronan 5-epimerase AlgG [Pseudomonas subflava]|uniref:mannuronan 5-epimerase AlgG n=1 Tax=Pseudomonas subflava TaxID=2952933 RepID=UPI00207A9134|nr:mannuronan 5-epimerase AlgG [Pseudomonas subflava]
MAGNAHAVNTEVSPEFYRVSSAPAEPLQMDPPKLPDLTPFTPAAVEAKIVRKPAAKVSLQRMTGMDQLTEFTGGDERLREWVSRQRGMPQAIVVEGGYLTPAGLAKALQPRYFAEVEPGVYMLRAPLVVMPGATLHIDKATKDFRMSTDRGAFLINDGKLFITDTRVTAWREADNKQDWFAKKGQFRPFINAWGGTETYVVGSTISSLGYTSSKSYGFSISQYSPSMHPKMKRGHPTGWLLNSKWDDMWYGFYCYEADDVVIRGNTYINNLVYGIDPHDRSRRLIIAENTAYGTKQKHGIIVSREVNDSWIFHNRSYENELSGIVIDRSSVNNVLAYNETYRNKSDGVTIYESGNNLLWGNKAYNNERHGIRVRNSMNIKLYENLVVSNGKLGVYGHVKDLSNTDRDLLLDPFETSISMLIVGGKLVANSSGPMGVDSPLSLELYRVEMLSPTKSAGITLPGILGPYQDKILDLMVRQDKPVLIDYLGKDMEAKR